MSQGKWTASSRRNERSVDEYLAASIDAAIGEMLGEAVLDSFYVHLNEKGISRRDVPNKIKLFCSLLDETFGIQSEAIQRVIAKKLCERLGLLFSPVVRKGLIDYIVDAKEMMMHVEA